MTLVEVDRDDLDRVSRLIIDDTEGEAEFGAFYGLARVRLGPLLQPDVRRIFFIDVEDETVGFIDGDRQGDTVGIAFFIRSAARGNGYAQAALTQFVNGGLFPDATRFEANIASTNTASAAAVRRVGFTASAAARDDTHEWFHPANGELRAPLGSDTWSG